MTTMSVSSANILLVDDEESIRKIFASVLEREGYNVVIAADGHEAIEEFGSRDFELAIVDINIPGPDGIEILKYIKNTGKDTEVIIISGYASLDTAIEAMRQGAYDYIVKPLDIRTIPDTVARGLEKHRRTLETKQLLAQLERKTLELAALYELRDAIGYTLDYRELVRPTMRSLHKIIDHDASAFLFMTSEDNGELTIWVDRDAPVEVVDQVKLNLINAYNSVSANKLSTDDISVYVSETDEPGQAESSPPELKSFLNVALVIRDEGEDRLAGVINISSYKENAFDLNTSRLFYNIANNMSNALEKLTKVLAGEKSKLEMMVRSMTDGVIMFDQRGHITVLNPAARKMLGLDEIVNAEHLSQHIGNTRLSRVLDRVSAHRDMNESILGDDGFEEEIFIERTKRFLSANVAPIKSDDDRTHGVVAVLRDITKRKEIDEAKSAFVSAVSHELRTPLTAIKNAITIIEMAGEVNEQQKKFLAISERNIERLGRLINRILDFSRLEDGKLEMEFGLVNLKKLAQESISALQNLATGKSIEIIDNIPDDLPEVYADYHRLDQVFTNLLDNAIKYTPANGRITIDAKLVDTPSINGRSIVMPRSLPNPTFVEVSISDTGIGIPLEDQKRIFDRFEQAGTSYKMGVGLGLSIVKKIIENHYGEIWVESEPGKGSKFTFVLPVDKGCNRVISLIKAIDEEIEVAATGRSLFSLILVQVENFSGIVEEYGDAVMDEILTDIEHCIQSNTRVKETVTCNSESYGFMFCFYEGDREAAVNTKERISTSIHRRKFPKTNPVVDVRVNTWIAVYPDDGASAADLIDALAKNCTPQAVDSRS